MWKSLGNACTIDDEVTHFGVTPRQIIQSLAEASMELHLPHPVHIHCNNLGIAGNWKTTLETMKALDGRRGHLAHVQFHSYGGRPGGLFTSHVRELAEYVNTHPNLTVDVGQVLFGDTTSMTGDGPLGYMLHKLTGRKWINADVENEEGCGIVPIEYKDKSHVHTTQWAIGLEWYLLLRDPWRVAISTDHPNGASFVSYPRIIRLLMDREYRREALKKVNPKSIAKTVLPDLDREYSLSEIAVITRAAPARILGLKNKGHLGVGAMSRFTTKTTTGRRCFPLRAMSSKKVLFWSRTGRSAGKHMGKRCMFLRNTIPVSKNTSGNILRSITPWSLRIIRYRRSITCRGVRK